MFSEPFIPSKPSIIKLVSEQKPTRPVKLKLAHRQKQQEVDRIEVDENDEEPEDDELMTADSYRQVSSLFKITVNIVNEKFTS